MKKFWNKAEKTNDIYIYGDITSYGWLDNDTTAKGFTDDLNSFNGQDVTVHLNSGGGDVFQALAIHNAIKNYSGGVTVSIDGLAASAASLIAMAGKPTKMASNALMMIHSPAVGLYDFYDAEALTKIQNSLAAVTSAIIETYSSRLQGGNIEEMIKEETWFNASRALELGLVDEITGEVSMQVDNAKKLMFVNSLAIDIKNYDAKKISQAMEAEKMEIKDEKGFFDKLKATIADVLTPKAESATEAPVANAEQIRQQELTRIRDLQALKCENSAVNALIDVAIKDGREVKDIQSYVDAIKAVPVNTPQNAADKIVEMIKDQMTSGAEGVSGGQESPDARELRMKKVVEFANGLV